MPWFATFLDGPAADTREFVFSVGEPWLQIVLAPLSRRADPWVIVGGDRIRDAETWPGQVGYRLHEVAVDADGDSIARYREVN